MSFLDTKKGLFSLGIVAGIGAALLAFFGNPKNMAFCIACFVRDMSGALKLHQAEVVQYFRPEIVGIVLGAFLLSLYTKEFKATGGSSPVIRFFGGVIMMVCALVFLGCPLRMILRMSAGDISSYFGLIGFVLGIGAGSFFIKKGFSLGRTYETKKESGYFFPIILGIIFVLTLVVPSIFAFSEKGPGSLHAPALLSLCVGLLIGVIAFKTRMCFSGCFRNIFLMKDFKLFSLIGGIFVVMLIYNIATKNFAFVAFGPIAHAQNIWNVLSMFAVGFAGVLLGGCPLRQVVLAAGGSFDSFITFLGMLVGAAFAHNFSLAASPAAAATAEKAAVLGGPGPAGKIFVIVSILFLLIIALLGIKKDKA